MIKFLCKTALAVGIVGLALEGVKKVLENRDEAKHGYEEDHDQEQFITITTSVPTEPQTTPESEQTDTVDVEEFAELVEPTDVEQSTEPKETEEPEEVVQETVDVQEMDQEPSTSDLPQAE